MSQSQQSNGDQSGNQRYTRQPAVRATGAELNQAKDEYKVSDSERAPGFQTLPTGVGANRALIAGTVTEIKNVSNDDDPYIQAKVATETETVYVYAGRYSEEARSDLQEIDAPAFVAICGKMDWFAQDDAPLEERRVSLDAEWAQEISEARRDEILLENAMATIERADGAGNEALVERAEEQYKFDEDFESVEQFRQGAVEAIENIDANFVAEEESEVEEEEPVPA